MATLEAVTKELADLRYLSEVDLESSFERSDAILSMVGKNDEMLVVLRNIESLLMDAFESIMSINDPIEKIVERSTSNIRELMSSVVSSNQDSTETLVQSSEDNTEDLIEAGEDAATDAEREKKRDAKSTETTTPKDKEATFKKSFKEGKTEDLGDMFGLKSLQQRIGKTVGNLVQVLSLIGSNLLRFSGIGTLVVGAFNGVFKAFEWFENQEGTIGQKMLAGLEGFFQGIVEVIAFPLDWIKEKISAGLESLIGENAISDLLDSFSYLETFQDLVNGFFLVIEDIGEIISSIATTIGESVAFQEFKNGMSELFEMLKKINVWIADKVGFVMDALGFDQNNTEAKQLVELTEDQQGDQVKSSRQSGLYNKNLIGESVVDESKLDAATPAQLQAILNDEDLSPEQQEIVEEKLIGKMSAGTETGVDQNQVFTYTQGDTAMERASQSNLGRAVTGSVSERTSPNLSTGPQKVGRGTLGTAITLPATPMVMVQAPAYQTPSAVAANNFESYTSNMAYQQSRLDNSRNEQNSGGSVAMVSAPSTTNVSNNTTQYQGGSIVVSNPVDNTVSNYRR